MKICVDQRSNFSFKYWQVFPVPCWGGRRRLNHWVSLSSCKVAGAEMEVALTIAAQLEQISHAQSCPHYGTDVRCKRGKQQCAGRVGQALAARKANVRRRQIHCGQTVGVSLKYNRPLQVSLILNCACAELRSNYTRTRQSSLGDFSLWRRMVHAPMNGYKL